MCLLLQPKINIFFQKTSFLNKNCIENILQKVLLRVPFCRVVVRTSILQLLRDIFVGITRYLQEHSWLTM